MGIFLRSAAAEVYEQFPDEQRIEIVREVSATLGRPVEVEWLRKRDLGLSERDEGLIPDDVKEEMRHQP